MESKNEMNQNINTENDQEINLLNKPKDDGIQVEKQAIKNKFSSYYGIIYGLISALCLSTSTVLTKKANFFHGSETALLRYIIQLIIMILMGVISKNNLLGPKESRKTLIIRGICGSIAMISLNYSIKLINPSDTSALMRLNIVIIPIFARFFIKEKFGLFNFMPLVMSILGVFFIAQPSFLFKKISQLKNFNNCSFNLTYCHGLSSNEDQQLQRIFGIIFGLLTAFFSAFVTVLMKKLTNKKVHFSIVIVYASYVGLPISFLISLVTFLSDKQIHDMTLVQDLPSILYQIGFAVMAGILGVCSQVLMNFSLKYEDSSKVSIIRATDLFYSFLFQYLILNIKPNLFSIFGACMILFATLLIILFQTFEKISLKEKNTAKLPKWKKYLFLKL